MELWENSVRRDFGWCVVQPPTQSRLSSAVTPGCSRPCPASPLKSPRAQAWLGPSPIAWLASGGKCFFVYPARASRFN